MIESSTLDPRLVAKPTDFVIVRRARKMKTIQEAWTDEAREKSIETRARNKKGEEPASAKPVQPTEQEAARIIRDAIDENEGRHDFGDGNRVPARRHTNRFGNDAKGGWVAATANINPDAIIGPNVIVSGKARVYGGTKLLDNVVVTDNAVIGPGSTLSGNAYVGDHAQVRLSNNSKVDTEISGNVRVIGGACIYGARLSGNVVVTDDARISGGVELSGDEHIGGITRLSSNDPGAKALDIYRGGEFFERATFNSEDQNLGRESPEVMVKSQIAKDIGARMSQELSEDEITYAVEQFRIRSIVDKAESNYERIAAGITHLWAESSGDEHPASLAVQQVAKQVFADKVADAADPMAIYKVGGAVNSKTNTIVASHKPAIASYLNSVYNNTQETLKRLGVEEVTLYRGLIDSSRRGDNSGEEEHTDLGNINPLTSFTTNREVALGFAASAGRADQVILKVKVPRDRVFSTSATGIGCYDEDEVVILGGDYDCEVEYL
ncbi:MAG: hypothetical protein IMZ61_08825 [Planctomycetes bacterium]|nr:hypothetical protein [Planctomycetota bacterium]